jgi:hypothetical protein
MSRGNIETKHGFILALRLVGGSEYCLGVCRVEQASETLAGKKQMMANNAFQPTPLALAGSELPRSLRSVGTAEPRRYPA